MLADVGRGDGVVDEVRRDWRETSEPVVFVSEVFDERSKESSRRLTSSSSVPHSKSESSSRLSSEGRGRVASESPVVVGFTQLALIHLDWRAKRKKERVSWS